MLNFSLRFLMSLREALRPCTSMIVTCIKLIIADFVFIICMSIQTCMILQMKTSIDISASSFFLRTKKVLNYIKDFYNNIQLCETYISTKLA